MTIKCGPFNAVNYDRAWKAEDFATYFSSFIGDGVYPNPSTNLQVIEGDNMTTVVKPGLGWINGRIFINDSDYVLQHDIADGILKRIDRVVFRLNYLNRDGEIVIKKGTPASNPVAPLLQRDADMYELALADVLINNGATQITQANITDLRLNNELCGIVHGTVDQVDTTTIFNQYTAWFNSVKDGTEQEISDWQQQVEQTFNDWFDTVKGILEGDVATNLANRIATLEQDFASHQADDAKHITPEERNRWNDAATQFSVCKSEKDENGIFTVVEYKRADGTLYARSVLSGGTSPQYTTRTITYYAADGTTVIRTDPYTLVYDADGDLISEVKQ